MNTSTVGAGMARIANAQTPWLTAALVLSAGLASCKAPAVPLTINLATKSCDTPQVDALANVMQIAITAYGPDITTPIQAKSAISMGATGTIVVPNIPLGTARNIVFEGFLSDGTTLVSRGETGPIDLTSQTQPQAITIFVQPADSFAYANSSDAPTVCAALMQPRAAHTATVLENGTVLIAGGFYYSGSSSTNQQYTGSTEIFDPTTGHITVGPEMKPARAYHTATHLPGTPLTVIAGGESSGSTAIPNAVIYDESSNTFSAVSLHETPGGRTRHAAVLAPAANGTTQLLLLGGYSGSDAKNAANPLSSGEIFNPATQKFSDAGLKFPNNVGIAEANAIVTSDGRVMVAGGWTGTAPNQNAYLLAYSTTTGRYTNSGGPLTLKDAHIWPAMGALGDGASVVVAGGFGGRDASSHALLMSSTVSEFFSFGGTTPTSSFSMPTNSALSGPGGWSASAVLADGTLLISGGVNLGTTMMSTGTADIFTLNQNATEPGLTKTMPSGTRAPKQPRYLHRLTLLPDGRVLVSGGIDASSGGTQSMVTKLEVYEPNYVASGNSPHSMGQ